MSQILDSPSFILKNLKQPDFIASSEAGHFSSLLLLRTSFFAELNWNLAWGEPVQVDNCLVCDYWEGDHIFSNVPVGLSLSLSLSLSPTHTLVKHYLPHTTTQSHTFTHTHKCTRPHTHTHSCCTPAIVCQLYFQISLLSDAQFKYLMEFKIIAAEDTNGHWMRSFLNEGGLWWGGDELCLVGWPLKSTG